MSVTSTPVNTVNETGVRHGYDGVVRRTNHSGPSPNDGVIPFLPLHPSVSWGGATADNPNPEKEKGAGSQKTIGSLNPVSLGLSSFPSRADT